MRWTNHGPRLAVEVAQLRVLRVDLRRVDLGRRGDNVGPPVLLVDLLERNGDLLAVICSSDRRPDYRDMSSSSLANVVVRLTERPRAVVHLDVLEQLSLDVDGGILALACDLDVGLVDGDGKVARL